MQEWYYLLIISTALFFKGVHIDFLVLLDNLHQLASFPLPCPSQSNSRRAIATSVIPHLDDISPASFRWLHFFSTESQLGPPTKLRRSRAQYPGQKAATRRGRCQDTMITTRRFLPIGNIWHFSHIACDFWFHMKAWHSMRSCPCRHKYIFNGSGREKYRWRQDLGVTGSLASRVGLDPHFKFRPCMPYALCLLKRRVAVRQLNFVSSKWYFWCWWTGRSVLVYNCRDFATWNMHKSFCHLISSDSTRY